MFLYFILFNICQCSAGLVSGRKKGWVPPNAFSIDSLIYFFSCNGSIPISDRITFLILRFHKKKLFTWHSTIARLTKPDEETKLINKHQNETFIDHLKNSHLLTNKISCKYSIMWIQKWKKKETTGLKHSWQISKCWAGKYNIISVAWCLWLCLKSQTTTNTLWSRPK